MAGPNRDMKLSRPSSMVVPRNQSLIDFSTPASDVSAFCRAVLSKLIPDKFWGIAPQELRNKAIILQKVDQFVRLRRFESLSLHVVFQGLEVVSDLSSSSSSTDRTVDYFSLLAHPSKGKTFCQNCEFRCQQTKGDFPRVPLLRFRLPAYPFDSLQLSRNRIQRSPQPAFLLPS